MRYNRLDLNLLVALDALLTERNVTAAADRMNLSQSAMSGALARLREYFADELFVQVGRKLVLTPLAEELINPVRNILLQVDVSIINSPTFDPAVSTRKFSIAASDYTITILLSGLLRRVQALGPNITFDLVLVNEHSIDNLQHGELDLLIVPKDLRAKEHPFENLFSDGFVCIVSEDSELTSENFSLDRYLAARHVVVRHGTTRLPGSDENYLKHVGYNRIVDVVAPSFGLVPQLVVGTSRVATLPRRLALRYSRYLPLRLLPSPVAFPVMQWCVQWHKYREHDPGCVWLRRRMQDLVTELD